MTVKDKMAELTKLSQAKKGQELIDRYSNSYTPERKTIPSNKKASPERLAA